MSSITKKINQIHRKRSLMKKQPQTIYQSNEECIRSEKKEKTNQKEQTKPENTEKEVIDEKKSVLNTEIER
jgi:hypothetical protein